MDRSRVFVARRWHTRQWRLTLLALVALLGATACGGGTAGVAPPCAPTSGSVGGCVTDSRGGSAVSDALITASPTATTTSTDAQGRYALSLSPGTYDITATKSGMAASKLQGVIVQTGQTATANLILPRAFDATKPVLPPTISVTGLSQGDAVTGTRSFTVNVLASNPVRRIDLRTSNMNALPEASATDTDTATFTLNSTSLANGAGFVDIVVYDLNQNVAELVVGFTVSNAVSGGAPPTPTGLFPIAVTTGQSLSLFSAQRAQRFSTLRIALNPNVVKVEARSINLLTAPPNATLFVEVDWNSATGAVGYKVFRSFSSAGPFAQIAETSANFYDDADPSLAPDIAVFYRVSAYNAGGESAPTMAVSVTPLAAFNLNLASPANNATSVSTVPTFTWAPTASVGQDRFYDIYVQGVNDSSQAWITTGFSIVNSTSIVYGTLPTVSLNPLTNGKVYQWDIYEAEALTLYGPASAPYSAAIALANGGGLVATVPAGSLNGPFNLTTSP